MDLGVKNVKIQENSEKIRKSVIPIGKFVSPMGNQTTGLKKKIFLATKSWFP